MKVARFLLIVLVIGLAAVAARADVVDPKITVGGGGSCESHDLTSLTQSFNGIQTGCLVDFTNKIGLDDDDEEFDFDDGVFLTQIVVNVTSAFSGPLSCEAAEGSPFQGAFVSSPTSCTFTAAISESLLSFLTQSGVGPNGVFSLTFDTNFGSTVDVTLAQNVISTPEPASALLLLTGAGALFAIRKRRKATA